MTGTQNAAGPSTVSESSAVNGLTVVVSPSFCQYSFPKVRNKSQTLQVGVFFVILVAVYSYVELPLEFCGARHCLVNWTFYLGNSSRYKERTNTQKYTYYRQTYYNPRSVSSAAFDSCVSPHSVRHSLPPLITATWSFLSALP